MRRFRLVAPVLPLVLLASACGGGEEEATADSPEEEADVPEAETDWEPREADSHTAAQPRLAVADADSGAVLIVDVLSGETLGEIDADSPAELAVADAEGSWVLLTEGGADTAQLLDTGIGWEAHGGHLDPDNSDPALVNDDHDIADAQAEAEEDHFDTHLVEVTGDDTVAVTDEHEGSESEVELPAPVAAAVWDPYWERGIVLTTDGQLHAVDPESGEITHSAEVTAEFEGDAALAAGESHAYLTNPATAEVIEVEVSREGFDRDRSIALDFTPGDLVVVGLEPLDADHDEDDHEDEDEDHEEDDDH